MLSRIKRAVGLNSPSRIKTVRRFRWVHRNKWKARFLHGCRVPYFCKDGRHAPTHSRLLAGSFLLLFFFLLRTCSANDTASVGPGDAAEDACECVSGAFDNANDVCGEPTHTSLYNRKEILPSFSISISFFLNDVNDLKHVCLFTWDDYFFSFAQRSPLVSRGDHENTRFT